MSDYKVEDEFEWDLEDRDARLDSGELTDDVADPTVVIVSEDE